MPVMVEGLSPVRLYFGRPICNPMLSMLPDDDLEEPEAAQQKAEDREDNRNDNVSIYQPKPLELV